MPIGTYFAVTFIPVRAKNIANYLEQTISLVIHSLRESITMKVKQLGENDRSLRLLFLLNVSDDSIICTNYNREHLSF